MVPGSNKVTKCQRPLARMNWFLLKLEGAGWKALTEKLGPAGALKFILDYDRYEGNYTELRKKIFKGKTVNNIIQDMKKDRIIWFS